MLIHADLAKTSLVVFCKFRPLEMSGRPTPFSVGSLIKQTEMRSGKVLLELLPASAVQYKRRELDKLGEGFL